MKKLFIILLGVGSSVCAQTIVKNIPAKRTTHKVLIDGKINEAAWTDEAKFDELVEFRPTYGRKEAQGNQTEAWKNCTEQPAICGSKQTWVLACYWTWQV